MKDFNRLVEIANEAQQVFLPDRYPNTMCDPFQELTGIEVPKKIERNMKAVSSGKTFRWTRGRSIPRIVALAAKITPEAPTIGLTGSEWCAEYTASECFADQPSGDIVWGSMSEERLGRLALIAKNTENAEALLWQVERSFSGVNVVTAYPNLVSMMGISGRCNLFPQVAIDGGVEGVADALGKPAVDLVVTGETLETNGFQIVKELMDTYPALVIAKGAYGEAVQ